MLKSDARSVVCSVHPCASPLSGLTRKNAAGVLAVTLMSENRYMEVAYKGNQLGRHTGAIAEQRRIARFQPQPEFPHGCGSLGQRRSSCRGLGAFFRPAALCPKHSLRSRGRLSVTHVCPIRHTPSAFDYTDVVVRATQEAKAELDEKMHSSRDNAISVNRP